MAILVFIGQVPYKYKIKLYTDTNTMKEIFVNRTYTH